jgi:hypothetical protein
VDLKPAAITPELASAALASPALSGALKLADWVGDGRELTDSGVLRPAAARQACAALGFDLPPGRKLRSALDVPELARDWEVARAAGLITLSAKRVYGLGFHDVAGDPAATVEAWLRGVAAPFGIPDERCRECLTVVALLAAAGGRDGFAVRELLDDVEAAFPDEFGECPDCGEVHALASEEDAEDTEQHALFSLAFMRNFGAVADAGDDLLTLTPLGQMLVASVFAALAPAPEDGADAVLTRLGVLPAVTAVRYAGDWLAARTPVDAARELFVFAETAIAPVRAAAFAFAEELGPDAAPAWRELAPLPGYGAYARSWLAEQGEDVAAFPGDAGWFAAEMFSSMLDEIPPELTWVAVGLAVEEIGAEDYYDAIAKLTESGHPDAPAIIDLLRVRAPESPAVSVGPAATPWPALAPQSREGR